MVHIMCIYKKVYKILWIWNTLVLIRPQSFYKALHMRTMINSQQCYDFSYIGIYSSQ